VGWNKRKKIMPRLSTRVVPLKINSCSQWATITARDTSREIHETARELKARGVNRDTTTAVDETARSAMETAQTVSTFSEEARHVAPRQDHSSSRKSIRNSKGMCDRCGRKMVMPTTPLKQQSRFVIIFFAILIFTFS
jgi:hypothetical protein